LDWKKQKAYAGGIGTAFHVSKFYDLIDASYKFTMNLTHGVSLAG
jgi:hypothetical protein